MPTATNLDPAGLLPPFDNSLPATLRLHGEGELLRVHAMNRSSYTTRRFLFNPSDSIGAASNVFQFANGNLLQCEENSPELVRYAVAHGLKLASDDETSEAIGLVKCAITDVIEPFQFLRAAVSELAWRCHIILAKNDDYDMSFSDPGIPFSIFISVPGRYERTSVLRVAENLIHETMHLHLSLFESLSPLVNVESTWSMYSPWKHQNRPAQGILHGLYVFSVLRWMWLQVSQKTQSRIDLDFALRRITEIDEEVSAVQAIERCPVLTEAGKHMLQQLCETP